MIERDRWAGEEKSGGVVYVYGQWLFVHNTYMYMGLGWEGGGGEGGKGRSACVDGQVSWFMKEKNLIIIIIYHAL